jgi:hypothetical protein
MALPAQGVKEHARMRRRGRQSMTRGNLAAASSITVRVLVVMMTVANYS